jgi:lipopolysaccharide export system protein LptA
MNNRIVYPFSASIIGTLAFVFVLSSVSPQAHAEKNDAYKPAIIDSERATINEATQTRVFEGNVIISKGTLLIKADRIEATIDPQGYQMLKATGSTAKHVKFQQKRDGLDEIIEAESVSLLFDGKADTVTLADQATIRRVAKGVLQDEIRGAQIKYSNQTEFYEVLGGASSSQSNGRVRTIIAPRNTPPVLTPASK